MKRLALAVATVALSLTLTACGEQSAPPAPKQEENKPAATNAAPAEHNATHEEKAPEAPATHEEKAPAAPATGETH